MKKRNSEDKDEEASTYLIDVLIEMGMDECLSEQYASLGSAHDGAPFSPMRERRDTEGDFLFESPQISEELGFHIIHEDGDDGANTL